MSTTENDLSFVSDSELATEETSSNQPLPEPEPSTATLNVYFMDFAMNPVEGLSFRVTDKKGKVLGSGACSGQDEAISFEGLTPNQTVEVQVRREFDGTYKPIGQVALSSGAHTITCISPKIKLEAETQLYQGEPGTAEQVEVPVVTPWNPLDEAPEVNESVPSAAATPTNDTAPQASSSNTSTYTVVSGDTLGGIANRYGMSLDALLALNPQVTDPAKISIGQAITVSGTPSAPSTTSANTKSTTSNAASKPASANSATVCASNQACTHQSGRDSKGVPTAVVMPNALNAASTFLAGLWQWAWDSFNSSKAKAATHANPKVNATQDYPPASKEALRLLKLLCEFEEKQVTLAYGPKGGVSTSVTLGRYEKGKTDWPSKSHKPESSLGACLAYVKIAMARCGWTNGHSDTGSAKDSGKDWEAYGFSNATGSLPKVKIWMNNGDCIEQPDLVYTLPGDVIVYEEYKKKNHGHVDIRTYHGFGSDFMWGIARNGFPAQNKYKVIGVYRKYSDTLAGARVQAFLRIIREHETRGFPEEDRYYALPDPSGKTHPTFTDTSKHPFSDDDKLWQKPAGAYQIKYSTFGGRAPTATVVMHWIKNQETSARFDKDMQDRVAIYLLQGRPMESSKRAAHPIRTALGYIMEGDVEKAVNETGLYQEWACLPGGGRQALMSMDELKALFTKYVTEYSKTH